MLDKNKRLQEFRELLRARGVTMRCVWQGRRDGRAIGQKYPADIECVTFHGNGLQPNILMAVITDHGADDGFGIFYPSTTIKMDADVDAICGVVREIASA